MPGFPGGGLGPGFALVALLGLALWLVILTWLGGRILALFRLRFGWTPLDPRGLVLACVLLTAAIHLGNYALDVLERGLGGNGAVGPPGFPGTFLIASVAIGVGIAAVRQRRG